MCGIRCSRICPARLDPVMQERRRRRRLLVCPRVKRKSCKAERLPEPHRSQNKAKRTPCRGPIPRHPECCMENLMVMQKIRLHLQAAAKSPNNPRAGRRGFPSVLCGSPCLQRRCRKELPHSKQRSTRLQSSTPPQEQRLSGLDRLGTQSHGPAGTLFESVPRHPRKRGSMNRSGRNGVRLAGAVRPFREGQILSRAPAPQETRETAMHRKRLGRQQKPLLRHRGQIWYPDR